MKHCPHKDDQDGVNTNVHITFWSSKLEVLQKSLILTVWGRNCWTLDVPKRWLVALGWKNVWIHKYEETIKNVPSKSAFRFSDGAEASSFKKVTLNIVTGQDNTKIDVEIVDNIPALNSKGAMKQLGMKLDFKAKL